MLTNLCYDIAIPGVMSYISSGQDARTTRVSWFNSAENAVSLQLTVDY